MEMSGVVYIKTEDFHFAQVLSRTLDKWKIPVRRQENEEEHLPSLIADGVDVVLLDIRHRVDEAMKVLRWLKRHSPAIEVITLNTMDRVAASMEAMRAGAADELAVPIDAETFKEKIMEAFSRKRLAEGCVTRCSLLQRFSQSMAASAFAEAGEFETAVQMLHEEGALEGKLSAGSKTPR